MARVYGWLSNQRTDIVIWQWGNNWYDYEDANKNPSAADRARDKALQQAGFEECPARRRTPNTQYTYDDAPSSKPCYRYSFQKVQTDFPNPPLPGNFESDVWTKPLDTLIRNNHRLIVTCGGGDEPCKWGVARTKSTYHLYGHTAAAASNLYLGGTDPGDVIMDNQHMCLFEKWLGRVSDDMYLTPTAFIAIDALAVAGIKDSIDYAEDMWEEIGHLWENIVDVCIIMGIPVGGVLHDFTTTYGPTNSLARRLAQRATDIHGVESTNDVSIAPAPREDSGCPDVEWEAGTFPEPHSTVLNKWWYQLSAEEQKSAEWLGFTQSDWDEDNYMPLVTWCEMSDQERGGAYGLGYGPHSWPYGCNTNDAVPEAADYFNC